jgi:hypothetical protein
MIKKTNRLSIKSREIKIRKSSTIRKKKTRKKENGFQAKKKEK